MKQKNLRSQSQLIKLAVMLIAALTLANCRGGSSSPPKATVVPATTAIEIMKSVCEALGIVGDCPTCPVPKPAETPVTATQQTSPGADRSAGIKAQGAALLASARRIHDEAWFQKWKQSEQQLSGSVQLEVRDRVGTRVAGVAEIYFSCGTIRLFNNGELARSLCTSADRGSGQCLNKGSISFNFNADMCLSRAVPVPGTQSVEINLPTNSAHAFSFGNNAAGETESGRTRGRKGFGFKGPITTSLDLWYFPQQQASVIEVRQGMVSVTPVKVPGMAPVLDVPILLGKNQCVVTQPGLVAGPDIKDVEQRKPTNCNDNIVPVLLELARRENSLPATLGNIMLATDLANRPLESELGPTIRIRPEPLDFGSQMVGQQKILDLTIENRGMPSLITSKPAFDGVNHSDFALVGDDCSSKNIDEECKLSVSFTPGGPGERRGEIYISHNAPTARSKISLVGIGILPTINLKIDRPDPTTPLVFSTQKVGTSATRQVTVTNTGQATVKVKVAAEGPGKDAFDFLSHCPDALAPSGTCQIDVIFKPQTPDGFTANLSVTATEVAPNVMVARSVILPPVDMKGTGAVPLIKLDKPDLCFSKHKVVRESDPQVREERTLFVTNKGTAPLTVSNVTVSTDDFKIVADSCKGQDVAVAGECHVTVGFTPRKSRLREGTLTLTHDDTKASPTNVPLKGVGKHRNIFVRAYEAIFKRTKDPCK